VLTGWLVFQPMVRRIHREMLLLTDSETRLRSMTENLVDGLITIDEYGIVQSFNPAAERIFGYQANEVTGKNINILMPEPYHSQHDGYLRHYLDTGNKKVIGIGREVEGKRKDGYTFPMDLAVSEMFVGGKRVFVGTVRDISERKRSELTLKEQHAEVERSNLELQQFAYVASHDLQEPLRMVSSYTQLLAQRYQGKLDSDADEFIGFAVDGATRMQGLINDLLSYSRVQAKGKPLAPVDMAEVLELVLANLQSAIEESEAEVSYTPLPWVMGDASQLMQLLQNLISNAIKFRKPDDPPEIHISAVRAENLLEENSSVTSNPQQVTFSVTDNGIGIAPKYQERIFQIFQRLHSRNEYAGTGIGLAVVKRIVERHGGRIWVESEPGKRTTFYFMLQGSKS